MPGMGVGGQGLPDVTAPLPINASVQAALNRTWAFLEAALPWVHGSSTFCPCSGASGHQILAQLLLHPWPPPGAPLAPFLIQGQLPARPIVQSLPQPSSLLPGGTMEGGDGERRACRNSGKGEENAVN